MLHSLKKSVAKASAPSRGVVPPAEFLDLKLKLESVKRNIRLVDAKMTEANKAWSIQMMEQRGFSERFCEGYPTTSDDTYGIALEFAESSQALYDHFVRETSPESTIYNKMQQQVKVYLKEISDVEAMYPRLTEAKSETVRYQNKIDAIERGKKENDAKKSRNLQKMDSEREKYDDLSKTIVLAQKKALAKAPLVHRMALCAYWSANEAHIQIASRSMEKTAEFARNNEEELANLDIANLDIGDDVDFATSPEVPTATPESPASSTSPMASTPESVPEKTKIPAM